MSVETTIYPAVELDFPCKEMKLGDLSETIVKRVLRLANWDIGFLEGIVLSTKDLAIEMKLIEKRFEEDTCLLRIECAIRDKNKIDLCLTVVSFALHTAYEFLSRIQRNEGD